MRWWVALTLLVACQRPVEITDVSVEIVRPGVARVHFASSEAGRPSVRVEASRLNVATTPEGPEGTEHTVTVLGLKPDRPYTFTPLLAGGDVEGEPIAQRTPAVKAPRVQVERSEPSLACADPYVLVSLSELFGRSWVVILDRDGDVVWAEEGPPASFVTRVRPGRDGRSVLYNLGDANRRADIGQTVRVPLSGGEPVVTRTLNAHHDFVEHADGTLAWIGYDFRELTIDEQDLHVAADVIYEDREGADSEDSAREVFNVFDDYPPGLWWHDEMRPGYFLPDYAEFSHGNSLMYRESDEAYFLLFRWIDALVKVGRDGAFLWQLGGEHSDFSAPEADRFSHAHMTEIWDGGMLLFDNADHTGRVSGVVEYAFDEDARTYEKVWEYRDPSGGFELLLGDAHRMRTCDNVLVSWTTQRRLEEITRDGEIAWKLTSNPGWLIGRAVPLTDLYDLNAP